MQHRIVERAKYWAAQGKKMTTLDQCNRRAHQGDASPPSFLELNSQWAGGPVGVRPHSVQPAVAAPRASLPEMSIGLYYSTSTGNTETVAGYIADKAGIGDWKDIADAEADEIM